jgi:hypothetical protein
MTVTYDFTRAEHPAGKKYRAFECLYQGTEIRFSEDSRLVKNWNNGSYYYEPSGFLYLYTRELGVWVRVGNYPYDYAFVSGDDDFSRLEALANRLLPKS